MEYGKILRKSLQYLPPHSLKSHEYKEADWESLEKIPTEGIIQHLFAMVYYAQCKTS